MKYAVLTLCLFTASTFASVDRSTCEELRSLWQSKFARDFDVTWKVKAFECPSSDEKMAKAIYDVYKPATDYDYYDYSAQLTKKMYYDAECPKGVVATMRSDGVFKICPAFYRDNEASRAGTIVHEASHAAKGDPGHVKCTRGVSKGKRACDQTLHGSFKGSGYNHELIYYGSLLKETDYKELDRDLIRHTVKFMVNNRFNSVSEEQRKKWANI